MRVGTGVALLLALLMTAGCGSVTVPATSALVAREAPPKPTRLPDPVRVTGDSAAGDGYGEPDTLAEPQSLSEEPPETRSIGRKPAGLLTPGWAKEAEQSKEEWERDLDRKINNICRGC